MLHDRELIDTHGTLRTEAQVPFPDSIQALIAARLDTLAADRKSLLQDAAVIGKVFWVGAVCAMGDRDPGEVERALHELARKELVRPARQSSMQDEHELGFWHILVRDVAYAQIPRAQRAAKHVDAATWLETKAGDRVEDLAEVLAHHTGEALELAETTGERSLVEAVAPRARRYALLAGERALGLDAAKALQLLERALAMTPEDDPEQAVVLARWAEATYQAGNATAAVRALERAAATYDERSDAMAAAQALATLSEIQTFLGLPALPTVERAVARAETQPPGQTLVNALSSLVSVQWVNGNHRVAIAAADRAYRISLELDLPKPWRALGYRGLARCDLGDLGGVSDVESAIDLLIAEGKGHAAAALLSNLGYARWQLEGPVAAVEAFRRAQVFATGRGLVGALRLAASSCAAALVETGRLDEALSEAENLSDTLDHHDMVLAEVLGVQARVLAEREDEAAEAPARQANEWARQHGRDDLQIVITVGAALTEINAGRLDSGRELLFELVEKPGVKGFGEYAPRLPALIRCALGVGDAALAARLVEDVEPTLPVNQHALVTAAALLAEARGAYAEAAERFADAAAGWEGFGGVLEHAYALLGQGRCLAALGDPTADQALRQARALFDEMGARPRVDECDNLIALTSKLSS
jgi:tetratricopeptide (TPR) repeat protein